MEKENVKEGEVNEMHKKIIYLLVSCLLLTSCCTCNRAVGIERDVFEAQRDIAYLEARLYNYERAVASSIVELESIGERAAGMAGTFDDVIELLDEYQRTVERVISDYRDLEANKQAERKDTDDTYPCDTGTVSDQGSVHNTLY